MADDIDEIECIVDPIEVALICEPLSEKFKPLTPYEAKFSLPFMVASALVDGDVGMRTFTPTNIACPSVLDLTPKIKYRNAAPGETTFPKYFPGWIIATLRDGRRIEKRLDVNYGNPDNPMQEEDVRKKFLANVEGIISPAQAVELMTWIAGLEQWPSSQWHFTA